MNSPLKGQWRGALMFSLICVWINGCVNNREAGDLRRHRGHYDVNVMWVSYWRKTQFIDAKLFNTNQMVKWQIICKTWLRSIEHLRNLWQKYSLYPMNRICAVNTFVFFNMYFANIVMKRDFIKWFVGVISWKKLITLQFMFVSQFFYNEINQNGESKPVYLVYSIWN